uniref:Ulp1 protease family, C-terminal catalytic domain-containing protein n=1 Tax=Tanacetum cinerariifolium TaxID=118510 RepID=A0A699IGM6_TANCI|nr:hypothetical protein [Tanacetum cinerariifolium]
MSSEIPVLRLSKQKENPEFKAKVNVKRKMILSKEDDRKKKLKGKSKKDVSDFELETNVVDYSSDEANRKRKKLKIKAGLKRKRSGLDSSDSSKLDTKSKKKLTKKVDKEEFDDESVPKKGKKKLTKKVKKEESDEESVLKKGKKKEKQLTPKEAAREEYLSSFLSFHARATPSSFFSAIRNSRVDILGFLMDIGFNSLHNVSINHLLSKLGWFSVSKFKSYMLSFDLGDNIEVTPSKIHDMLGVPFGGYSLFDLDEREADHDFRLPGGTNHYLGPLTFFIELKLKDRVVGLLDLHNEWNEVEVQESKGFIGFLETSKKEDLIKKSEEKLSLICAERVMLEDYMRKASLKCPGDGKFVALHEKHVNLFKDPISFKDNGNGDNVGDDDDDENGDDDHGNVDNDVNDGDGNEDEEDVNEGDKDQNGSNSSFGFSRISLEDFGNDKGPAKKDKVVEGNPTKQGTVVEGNQAEECKIMSTTKNFTQWLDKNMDLVGEVIDSVIAMNQEITPDKLPTQKASPSPKKRAVKPSSYHLSLYMNKKTNVVPKITRMEIILGNILFATQGDKIENVFEAHFGKFIVYGVRLNLETLAPSFWVDANSKSMFDGTLAFFDAKWEIFSNQVNAQFKGNKGGLALGGIDLCHHIRHTQVANVKHTIPKLKWKTKENFHDCRIFTMLHMETFDGGPALNLDCGLLVELQLQRDMLRRIRFKFATKMLLHEINVHAGNMLELAKEFDKTDLVEKMMIIVNAFKKKKERDCI